MFTKLSRDGVAENRIIPDATILGLDDNAGCIKVMYSFHRRMSAVQILETNMDSWLAHSVAELHRKLLYNTNTDGGS